MKQDLALGAKKACRRKGRWKFSKEIGATSQTQDCFH